MSDAVKHTTDGIFFFGEDSTLVHNAHALYMQHSPTAAVLSTFFSWTMAPQEPRAECIDYKI